MEEDLYSILSGGNRSCDWLTGDPAHLTACKQILHCLHYINKDLNVTVFTQLCSLFTNTGSEVTVQAADKPSSLEVWGYGLMCVSLISLTSVLGVAILPLMSKRFYSRLLSSLIGLAVGSLSGSALFHLIPAAFRLSEVSFYPHHSYLDISLSVWLGLYLFFILERLLKIFMDSKARRQGSLILNHSHHLQSPEQEVPSKLEMREEMDLLDPRLQVQNGAVDPGPYQGQESDREPLGRRTSRDHKDIYEQSGPAIRASFGHMDKPHPNTRPTVEGVQSLKGGQGNRIATVAWMIIFGDGIHNFIDGLSIGAAFSQSILTGISVSVAVLCEEFPHELGDFAVLLNSGMRIKEALLYNFLSACTCYLGLILGILLGELDANCYIFGLAGGMFLYISLVDMVPEMNESVETASKTSVIEALGVFMLQNIGILLGIVCLYVLARYQDDIHFGE